MVQIPLWLDCDPGHDDVFAILLAAHHPNIHLLGISTVFGNASLEKTTSNASSVLTAIGRPDIPIYPGHANPLLRAPMHAPATSIHGISGLDGTTHLPTGTATIITETPAIDAMAVALKATEPGTAFLVATGALTNAAAMFEKYPELVEHIKGFSLMGGAVGDGFTDAILGEVNGKKRIGNWSPYAEFNILVDPEAADILFGNPVLAAKTTMVGLDLTHKVLVTQDVQKAFLYGGEVSEVSEGSVKPGEGKTVLRTMLMELLMFFAKTYADVFGITEGPPLHDPLAVAVTLIGTDYEIPFVEHDPTHTPERFKVTVITTGSYEEAQTGKAETGRTIVEKLPAGTPGVRIPRGVDLERFWREIGYCVNRADEVNAKLTAEKVAKEINGT